MKHATPAAVAKTVPLLWVSTASSMQSVAADAAAARTRQSSSREADRGTRDSTLMTKKAATALRYPSGYLSVASSSSISEGSSPMARATSVATAIAAPPAATGARASGARRCPSTRQIQAPSANAAAYVSTRRPSSSATSAAGDQRAENSVHPPNAVSAHSERRPDPPGARATARTRRAAPGWRGSRSPREEGHREISAPLHAHHTITPAITVAGRAAATASPAGRRSRAAPSLGLSRLLAPPAHASRRARPDIRPRVPETLTGPAPYPMDAACGACPGSQPSRPRPSASPRRAGRGGDHGPGQGQPDP